MQSTRKHPTQTKSRPSKSSTTSKPIKIHLPKPSQPDAWAYDFVDRLGLPSSKPTKTSNHHSKYAGHDVVEDMRVLQDALNTTKSPKKLQKKPVKPPLHINPWSSTTKLSTEATKLKQKTQSLRTLQARDVANAQERSKAARDQVVSKQQMLETLLREHTRLFAGVLGEKRKSRKKKRGKEPNEKENGLGEELEVTTFEPGPPVVESVLPDYRVEEQDHSTELDILHNPTESIASPLHLPTQTPPRHSTPAAKDNQTQTDSTDLIATRDTQTSTDTPPKPPPDPPKPSSSSAASSHVDVTPDTTTPSANPSLVYAQIRTFLENIDAASSVTSRFLESKQSQGGLSREQREECVMFGSRLREKILHLITLYNTYCEKMEDVLQEMEPTGQ
ncbi:uncharacterized protein SPPG_01671 [Spizellomyces punctatus DAOM BR117]|uniref:Uncharacterized protein n=1 Tax=Spizellomyces punctatus (strain DAOM BR117) TaxID=645134 RepID=A0A0L0HTL1_SPIPD|nr:uncharacterized protein SPPG_01671 [Spizellomyces punctatus DAOM BR117]KND04240.1 hypothetical protein SPPG_01671 [Spizellomyces punctatus DAOM BR117]|eukprot:XP_016612279.1 hypothetical protein SPPG_01671 [Spizellomyces punctatus DAOM BR117]